jgi:virginiamycin B lyase
VYEGSGSGGHGAQAVSEADGHVVWSYNNLSTSGQHPAVTASGVYLTDWCQNNYDFAPSDGHVIWSSTSGCSTGGDNVSPVYAGRLYSRTPGGPNQVFDGTTGAPVGTYRSDLNEAFDGGTGFLSFGNQLSAVDLATGNVLWRFNGDCDLLSSPVVANGYVYIGSTQGHLYALNEKTGAPVWSDSIGSPIGPHQDWSADGPPFGLAVGEGLLAVAAVDRLVLYAPGTGSSPAPPILNSEAVSHSGTTGQVFWITRGADGNLWATEFYDNKIARITTAGDVSEFNIPTSSSNPVHIVSGPDGALWFTELGGKIGRITTSGSFSEFPLSTNNAGFPQPYGITVGPDNNLWITEAATGQIMQMHTDGSVGTTVTLPGATPSDSRSPHGITTGPDGNLWVTEAAPGRAAIARITPAGSVTEFPLPNTIETDFAQPEDIVTGPDGNVWFTVPGDAGNPIGRTPVAHGELGRITTGGSISYFIAPTPFSSPYGLTVGPDGALWFTEARHGDNAPAKIGRLTTSGDAREYWDTGSPQIPRGIVAGPDGNLWFGDATRAVGRLVPDLGGCPVSSQPPPTPSPTPTPTSSATPTPTSTASQSPTPSPTPLPSPTPTAAPEIEAVAGRDSGVYQRTNPGTWQGLGGIVVGAPAIASLPSSTQPATQGTPFVVVTGQDHNLWTWNRQQGWQPLSSNPAYCIDNPAAAITSAQTAGAFTLTVACQGADHALWYAQATVSSLLAPLPLSWRSLGGGMRNGPAVAPVDPLHQTATGALTFFITGLDGYVYTRTLDAGWSKMPWGCIGHPAAATTLSSLIPTGEVTVFACQGWDHALWFSHNFGGGWVDTQSLGGILIDGPGVAVGPTTTTFFVEGQDRGGYHRTATVSGSVGSWTGDGGILQFGAGATALQLPANTP